MAKSSSCRTSAVVKHPESLSSAEAASVWMMFVTAYGALIEDAKVGKGDFVIDARRVEQRRPRGNPDRQLRRRDPDCAHAHCGESAAAAGSRRRARGRDRQKWISWRK